MCHTIVIPVTTADPMLAAMLRLFACSGAVLNIATTPAGDTVLDLPAAINALASKAAANAPVFDQGCQRDPGDDSDAAQHAPGGRLDEVVSAGANQNGIELDLLPPDDDATFRPARANADADDKRGEIDIQLAIVARLGDRPPLADVARHLLRPLAGKGWIIDGNREAVLTRLAEEFAEYRAGHLADAASRLLGGRHSRFPDMGEIYQALGRAAKPGSSQRKAA